MVLLVTTAFSQIATPSFTINGQTFLVKKITTGEIDPNSNSYDYVITNSQSPIKSGLVVSNGVPSELCRDYLSGYEGEFYSFYFRKNDFLRFFNILREVFPENRVNQLLANDKGIYFDFVINDKGVLLDIDYQFSADNGYTAAEIAHLDRRLRESMFFTLNSTHVCSGANMLGIKYEVRMNQLYTPFGYGVGDFWQRKDQILRDLIAEGEDPRN